MIIKTGSWRDDRIGPMQVTSGPIGNENIHFEAPSAMRLEGEMEQFLDWFSQKEKIDPVIKAALAHFWFATVHPFEDGNGRIARAIADMCLALSEESPKRIYSMSAQIRLERNRYYDILEKSQKGTLDVTGWLEWFLGCLGRAITNTQTTLSAVMAKAFFWEAHAGEPFNDRQRKILNSLLDGFDGKLKSSKWAKLGKCSQDTANRDINDLLARCILKKDPGGGRSTSYSINHP
jgi:Fic family protein